MDEKCDLVHRLRFMQEKYGDFRAYAIVISYFDGSDYTDYELAYLTEKLLAVNNHIGTNMITLQTICESLMDCKEEEKKELLASDVQKIVTYVSNYICMN